MQPGQLSDSATPCPKIKIEQAVALACANTLGSISNTGKQRKKKEEGKGKEGKGRIGKGRERKERGGEGEAEGRGEEGRQDRAKSCQKCLPSRNSGSDLVTTGQAEQ